ncbi:glycosyltransferase [Candidatus Gottesmanbacteria bacterium]|nr:glycosyltransferase [Candidatus Gottesmanbacteria bacterium]
MEDIFFSVVIPTLNEQVFLPHLLKSLANQTFRNFETMVVDSNSKDKTKLVFEKFQKDIPHAVFINVQKQNVSYQRNFGAANSKGSYLVFLDADVEMEPTFLEELHLAVMKKKFVLATTWIAPDSTSSIDQAMIVLANLAIDLAKSINKPFSGGYNTIVRKDIFEKLKGFNEKLPISEDHDFTIRAYKKGIDLCILREPRITMSLRRLRSEGTLTTLRKCAITSTHLVLKGPITKELFDYQMGGHVHKKRKKKKISERINYYLKSIDKIQDKLLQLLN